MKTCGIISIDAENVFDKIQYKLIIKSFSKPGLESNFFNLIKDVYEKRTSYFTVSDFMDFHSISRIRQECLLSSLLFSFILEVQASAVRQEEEMKGYTE